MKYLKIILFWIGLSIIISLIINYINFAPKEIRIGVFILMMTIGLLIGSTNALLRYFALRSKVKIFSEAKEMYNGKVNLKGETVLIIKGRTVILDYKLEQLGTKATEYIIANIDMTEIKQSLLDACKNEFEFVEKSDKIYAVIYSSWGFKGEDFKERIEGKIEIINNCIKKGNRYQ